MKRATAIILTIVLALTCSVIFASAGDTVQSSYDYDGFISSHLDTIRIDGEVIGNSGAAFAYLAENDDTVEAGGSELTVSGWIICDRAIDQIGYSIDEGEPVFKAEYIVEAEAAVFNVAEQNGVDFASRFIIPIDVSGITGRKSIAVVLKNSEGVFKVHTLIDTEIEFDYVREGTETEAPETTPDPEDPTEPILIRFNDEDKVDDFFMYSTNNSHVSDIIYDSDRNCAVIECVGGPDPNVMLAFGEIALDDTLDFFDGDISTAEYKAMVIIGRFDYGTILNDESKDVGGTFYFTTDESTGYGESKNLEYYYERTDDLQYVVLNFARQKAWKGSVDNCRFDFFMTTDNDCEYEIYFIGFFADEDQANEFVSSYKESGDSILPTPEPTPEPTATPEATEAPETEVPEATEPQDSDPTEAPEATADPSKSGESKKGCGGFITAMPVLAVLLSSVLFLKKKKD